MATKAKDSPTPGKELKKSTSAINTIPNHPRRLTKSSSTKSTTNPLSEPSSSSTSTKQIPNYLRPTLSASRHENALRPSSAGAKKHASDHQPTLNRRRSFDKPPSPSLLHKAIVSPGRDQTLRSSSFSSKTSSNSNVPKPGIERSNSKTSRAGNKPQPLPAKSVKKSNASGGIKKEISGGSTKASRDITQTLNLEADLEAIESLSNLEVEEVGKIETEEHEKVVLPDPKIEENQESVDAQVEGVSSANAEAEELAEELKENVQSRIEESGNALGQDNDQPEAGEIQDNQNGSGEVQEQEETKVEVKEEEKESEKEENGEDKALDEKEAGEGVVEEGKEAEAVEEAAKPPQQAGGGGTQGGRKEAAPAYNDVIEETASKLLEKRKNKVKALVGAFETVIDYESGSK